MDEKISLVGQYLKFNLKAAWEYRAAFFIQVFGMMLNNASFIIFWAVLFGHRSEIGGYGFEQVMFLWALAAFGFGMAEVFLGNWMNVSSIIFRGELDVYLLQPRNVPLNLLSSRMKISGWGDVLFGLGLYFLTQRLSIGSVALFFYCSALAGIIMAAVNLFYQSLTFYVGRAEEIAHLSINSMLSFSTYPGGLFTGGVRLLLTTLMPVVWIAYIPAELSMEFSWIRLLQLTLADGAILLVCLGFFYLGLRKYESGNLMGTRL